MTLARRLTEVPCLLCSRPQGGGKAQGSRQAGSRRPCNPCTGRGGEAQAQGKEPAGRAAAQQNDPGLLEAALLQHPRCQIPRHRHQRPVERRRRAQQPVQRGALLHTSLTSLQTG